MKHFPIAKELHTDVLAQKYGQISAKVLRHDEKAREAHLIDSNGISRTFAITLFPKSIPKQIKKINEQIKNGSPIGETFRQNGFEVRKNVLSVNILQIPKWLKNDFRTGKASAKYRISEFYAKSQKSKPVIYGTVIEIYSPDFREAKINQIDLIQLSAPTEALKKAGFSMQEIWEKIGDASLKSQQALREKANPKAGKLVREMENEIMDILSLPHQSIRKS
ncbi:MAG: hypothetical protein Q7R70_06320 [Candidatus Diapherotrites archaeon]|nr:hypothetical protein [Candidatus Diapherotrites archaeon]